MKFVPAVVMKSRLPSSSLRPWNVVVWAMRFKASSDESICNWLAAICSSLKAPVLADFGHQAANVVQQRADLAQRAVGRGDDLVGAVGVADGLA